jgi:hypothetical protein
MLEVAAAAEERFRQKHVGTEGRVLWEGRRAGLWAGTTDNYLKVYAESDGDLRGRLTGTDLTGLLRDGLSASLVV